MKIKKLEYYDDAYHWKLDTVEFLENLNLLVGVSGVGKTRILQSINSLRGIANGFSFNGVKWNICFVDGDQVEYSWSGEFETKAGDIPVGNELDNKKKFKVIKEVLKRKGKTIVDRSQTEIILNGTRTPKLSPFSSVVELLKEEDSILPVRSELDKIRLINIEKRDTEALWRLPVSIFKKYERSTLKAGLFHSKKGL
ncbi:MAG: hypothetical protein AAGD25_24080 [Cyanobacteria bacterium P01_F01_bin.150]